jgi:hypothetical protein
VADDVDFHRLAEMFDLTGGYIRNAALCSAYASHDAGVIRFDEPKRAAIEQTRAAGRLVRMQGEFKRWMTLPSV